MATKHNPQSTQSQTCENTNADSMTTTNEESTVVLTLRKPKSSKKVGWTEGTVDNEHLGRKKSKCCCIYRKPHDFGESSSESEDDECEHCHGHVELKKDKGSGSAS